MCILINGFYFLIIWANLNFLTDSTINYSVNLNTGYILKVETLTEGDVKTLNKDIINSDISMEKDIIIVEDK